MQRTNHVNFNLTHLPYLISIQMQFFGSQPTIIQIFQYAWGHDVGLLHFYRNEYGIKGIKQA